MRAEKLILALKARQYTTMENAFKTPPQNYEAYVKQLGIWIGLGEALSIIEDVRKAEENENY